ncbi:hypothetical protein Poli38472_007828 [Pythium oligandrum]|uniref:EGF-like domain-containing protein n=1 Tax=Pythium oligandrum TaxID=41045 RepID=A0A8K1CT53_PYTOL|nr:hypothetical protein Poli38472_007828 [Pythium oligandrum]|eukprot:TMW68156.1 hypothetical protein Poli38472_007828 [Pythium oligandrum]
MRSMLTRGLVLVVAALAVGVHADLGKECNSNYDCPEGAWCVAGDSEKAVQRCVAGTPCGGATLGSCPGDEVSGQLACIWRPDAEVCSKTPGGCTEIDNKLGIYKCISLDRCDLYFGDSQCSGSCNVNGKQCNGRGSCQLTSESGELPTFKCACENGWNGTRCDNVVDDSCIVDVGQCGDHGSCVKNACECKNGYTGVQCEIPPKSSSSGSGSSTISTSPSPTTKDSSNATATPASQEDKKDGGSNTLVIIIVVIVAVLVLAAAIFVVIARKRRQQQEADGSGFSRVDSANGDAILGGGPPTPKGRIVIM